jgi:hypothetical protein
LTERGTVGQIIRRLLNRKNIPRSLVGLAVLAAVLLLLLPPERTLGNTIKAVYIHGALVQTGLLAFGASGLLGLAYLARPRESLHQWCLAVQKTAVAVWVTYALSSMLATYLAWGVAIAWNEPRVQASAKVLGVCIAFLVLVLWVGHRQFTAAVNVVMAALAWWLTKSAVNLRHPFNPIGSSESVAFRWFFIAILLVVLLMAIQLARWLRASTHKE